MSHSEKARTDRWFYSYALASLAQGGSSLLIPLFAAGALGASVGQVGLITGIASLVGVPASIFWGWLSDRLQRLKPFAVLGFVGLSLGMAGMGLSRSLDQLTLFNALLGASWMAVAAVSTLLAIQRIETQDWELRIGAFNRKAGTGWVSGLLLGTLWTSWVSPLFGSPAAGMRGFFFLLAVIALGGALLGACWIVERPIRRRRLAERRFEGLTLAAGQLWERFKFAPTRLYHIPDLRRIREIIRGENGFGPELTRYYQGVVVCFIGFLTFFVPFPLFLRNVLHLHTAEIFALYIVHYGTSAYFNLRAGQLAQQRGNRGLQSVFLLVRAATFVTAGLVLTAVSSNHTLVLILVPLFFFLTGLSWAFINVTTVSTVSKLARLGIRGQALGIYNALAGSGSIIG